jgi:formate dehydrogenase major subunit
VCRDEPGAGLDRLWCGSTTDWGPAITNPGEVSERSVLHIVTNGTRLAQRPGGSVLDALRSAGIHVPALCHDDRIAPSGACRTCLVQVDGSPKLVAACTTRLIDGMEIETSTPELEEARRGILEMLVRRYPAAAVHRFPDKAFHQEIRRSGLRDRTLVCAPDPGRDDRSHPYIAVDMARCIDCYRCVRICAELQGQFVWQLRGRGLETSIEPDGPTLRESSCVSCGACADTCPTGALEDKTVSTLALPSQWTRTTCPYCGVGCELDVGTCGDRIVSIAPARGTAVSKGHLCVKGRYAFGFVSAVDRITEPMIRDGSGWRRVSWHEARSFVAGRLRTLIQRHGADSIAVLGSARGTNEDNYVTQKLARAVIGTNNVDCCARVCHAPSAAALKRAFGAGLATNSFDDIESARTILVCGANATEDHPIVGARIKQAALRGARLIVIDPRRIELARYADCHVALRPGTNVALLNAMAHTIVAEGWCDDAVIERRTASLPEFKSVVASWPPERAAPICGVEAETIRQAARLYATGAPAMSVHGLGLTEHVQGTDGVTALINLSLLTGNLGKPGTGINPLRGQNNVQGAAHMGCDPGVLPGSIPLDRGRHAAEALWGVPLPVGRGLHQLEMMDAALAGRLKALWAVGYDVLMTNPNATETLRALRSLELVIVQDLFLTETARECATVFLPACSSFEKDGTFMNAERRIQRVRPALRPVGASKPDWQILCEVARSMGGHGFGFAAAEDIWNEVRTLCEGARGMTYARLDQRGLQWPCPTERHPGTAILHRDAFAAGPRAQFLAVEYRPTSEVTTAQYPFMLITGRSLYQFNAGTMTGRTLNSELRRSDVLDLSPVDAARLGFTDGQMVRVTSRYGSVTLPLNVGETVNPGQLFATFQSPDIPLNSLTGPNRDAMVGTPEYKVTAVRVETIGDHAVAGPGGDDRAVLQGS